MASKEYFEEKSKLYYDSFLNNKSTRHVRGIIINDEGQVLLLYFNKRNGYSIPGGTVEENESIKDTVLREVLEETGADIIPIKIVGKYYHTSKNFNYEGINRFRSNDSIIINVKRWKLSNFVRFKRKLNFKLL